MWNFFKCFSLKKRKAATATHELPSSELIDLKYGTRPLLRREDLERMEQSHRELQDTLADMRQEAARVNREFSTELRKTKRRISVVMESIFDAALIVDSSGIICNANGRAQRLFKYVKHDLVGRSLSSMLSDSELTTEKLDREAEGYLAYRTTYAPNSTDFQEVYARYSECSSMLNRVQRHVGKTKIGDTFNAEVKINVFNLEASSIDRVFFLVLFKDVSDRDQALNKLETLTQLQRGILASIPNPIFYKDDANVVVGANDAFYTLFGLSEISTLGCINHEIFAEESAAVLDELDKSLSDDTTSDIQIQQLDLRALHSAHAVTGVLYCTSLRNSDGVYTGMIGTFVDINGTDNGTDPKVVVDSIPSAAYIQSSGGIYIACNARYSELVGIEIDQILGKTQAELYDPAPPTSFLEVCDAILPDGDAHESVVYNQKTGLVLDIVMYCRPFVCDVVHGTLSVILDVTEIKNIQRIHKHIFDSTPVPMYMKDETFRFRKVNQPYADWLGLHREQVEGRTVGELLALYLSGTSLSVEQQNFFEANREEAERIYRDAMVKDQELEHAPPGFVQSFEMDLMHLGLCQVRNALLYRIPVHKDGLFSGVIGSVIDVTQVRELKHSLVDTLQSPVVVVDGSGIIRDCNLSYAALIHGNIQHLVGQSFRPLPGSILENTNSESTSNVKEVSIDGVHYVRYSAETNSGLTAHMYFIANS